MKDIKAEYDEYTKTAVDGIPYQHWLIKRAREILARKTDPLDVYPYVMDMQVIITHKEESK